MKLLVTDIRQGIADVTTLRAGGTRDYVYTGFPVMTVRVSETIAEGTLDIPLTNEEAVALYGLVERIGQRYIRQLSAGQER
jgi:hypothetical protein